MAATTHERQRTGGTQRKSITSGPDRLPSPLAASPPLPSRHLNQPPNPLVVLYLSRYMRKVHDATPANTQTPPKPDQTPNTPPPSRIPYPNPTPWRTPTPTVPPSPTPLPEKTPPSTPATPEPQKPKSVATEFLLSITAANKSARRTTEYLVADKQRNPRAEDDFDWWIRSRKYRNPNDLSEKEKGSYRKEYDQSSGASSGGGGGRDRNSQTTSGSDNPADWSIDELRDRKKELSKGELRHRFSNARLDAIRDAQRKWGWNSKEVDNLEKKLDRIGDELGLDE